jgi:hypothetical protein
VSVSLGNDVFRKLCCECFRYVRINKAPADVTATVFISPNPGMGFYAVAGVEIIHCGARAAPATARHDNLDNVREIPLNGLVTAHPPKPPGAHWLIDFFSEWESRRRDPDQFNTDPGHF